MSHDLIAWWGAGLSTILGALRIWEIWRDRFKIEIGYTFPDSPGTNIIQIRNLSGRAVILCYWELLYLSGTWPFKKITPLSSPEQISDRRINPQASIELEFSETNYFCTDADFLRGRSIYIRMYFAGLRRPILKRVYGIQSD